MSKNLTVDRHALFSAWSLATRRNHEAQGAFRSPSRCRSSAESLRVSRHRASRRSEASDSLLRDACCAPVVRKTLCQEQTPQGTRISWRTACKGMTWSRGQKRQQG
eukprot:2363018-Amphidinium_carterae.1